MIGGDEGGTRESVFLLLEGADAAVPYDVVAAEIGAKLWLVIGRANEEAGDAEAREVAFERALDFVEGKMVLRPEMARLPALGSALRREHFELSGDEEELTKAIGMIAVASGLDPQNMQLALRWARLLEELGDGAGAVEHYQRALVIDENLWLDPLKQIESRERRRIELYIEGQGG